MSSSPLPHWCVSTPDACLRSLFWASVSRDLHVQQRDSISLPDSLRESFAANSDFLSWDFKDRPSIVRPLWWPPEPDVAIDFLRLEAASSKHLRSCRFYDFSGSRHPCGWSMANHQPCRLWGSCRFAPSSFRIPVLPDTPAPFEVFPSHPASSPSHTLRFSSACASRLKHPLSSLVGFPASPSRHSMLPSCFASLRGPLSATSGSCAICESVARFSAEAKMRPLLPWALYLHG